MTGLQISDSVLRSAGDAAGALCVPEGVTAIGDRAFSACTDLTELTLPEGLTELGEGAFFNCIRLRRVTLPATLRRIGAGAFRWCGALEALRLPAGLTEIADESFFGCAALTELSIPAGISRIGSWAFYGCSALRTLALPDTLRRIEDSAFRGCASLEELTLPEGLEAVGSRAFFGCESLKSVSLPRSLRELDPDAFFGCPSLEEYRAEAGGAFSTVDGVLYSADMRTLLAFPPASMLRRCAVPEGVEEIAPAAFFGAGELREITLPERVKRIGAAAFVGAGAASVRLPRTLEILADDAFAGRQSPVAICADPETAARLEKFVYLGAIDDLPERLRPAAAAGYLWAVEHGIPDVSRFRASYLAHFRAERERYLSFAAEDETLLLQLLEAEVVPTEALEGLLAAAARRERPDLTAALLDYQRRHFGAAPAPLDLGGETEEPPAAAPAPPPDSPFYGTGDR